VAAEARTRQAVGLRADVWTPQQVAAATGGRLDTRNVTAALWLPDEGRINPLTLLAHLGERARAAGATLVGDARAEAPTVNATHNGRPRWRVTLANDGAAGKARLTIHAHGLIDAVGPTTRPTARLYALAFLADLPDDFPLFWDAAPYVYYDYRGGDGRLVVSGGRYGQVAATERDASYHARMAEAARRWLPELGDQPPHYTWAVDLDTAADRLPAVISLAERDGRQGGGDDAPGLAIVGLGAQGVLPGVTLGQQAGEQLARMLR
jgi:glycine/D-amino acid oxidase-like deaminating enzyme